MLKSKKFEDILKSRLYSSWRAISQSPTKSDETIFQPQQRKFTRGELLCDREEDGVKPLSGAGQECGNQCSVQYCDLYLRANGSDWLKTVPSPSDWWIIDNISDSMWLVLRHDDSLSDLGNIVRPWDAPGYTKTPRGETETHQTLSQVGPDIVRSGG